jgi:outer membrane usher protein
MWNAARSFGLRILALLLVLQLAFGVADSRASEQLIPLDLQINGAAGGQITVALRPSDVLASVADLHSAGLLRFSGVRENIGKDEFVSLKSLVQENITYKLDDVKIRLVLLVPAGDLESVTVDASHAAPRSLQIERARRSAYLDYAVSRSNVQPNSVAYEAGVNVGSGILLSDAVISTSGIPAHTRLQFDDLPHDRRTVIGSAIADTADWGNLGSRVNLFGALIGREYSLQPSYVHSSLFGGFSGTVDSPTTAEVYVNGALVIRENLSPGPFSIVNLPLQSGANNTQLVLRDAYGRTRVIDRTFLGSAQLLRAGEHDYQFALGKPTVENPDGTIGGLDLTARYRVGLTRDLSLGASSEFSHLVQNAGASIGYASILGEFDGAFAWSRSQPRFLAGSVPPETTDQYGNTTAAPDSIVALLGGPVVTGRAAAFQYAYSRPRFSLWYAHTTRSTLYANLGLGSLDDRAVVESQITGTYHLAPSLGLTVSHRNTRFRDAVRQAEMTVGLNLPTRRLGYVSFAVGQRRIGSTLLPVSNLQYSFGTRSSTFNFQNSNQSGQPTLGLQVQRTVQPWETGIGYDLSRTTTSGETTQGAEFDYHGPYFNLTSNTTFGAGTGTSETYAIAGALTMVDNAVTFMRPVQSSFGLIEVPGAAGIRTSVDGNVLGRTDAQGRLWINNLAQYSPNSVELNLTDAPPDVFIETNHQSVTPSYRGGVHIRFPARVIRAYSGSIVIDGSKGALVPANGELKLSRDGKTVTSILGSDGRFYIDTVAPGVYEAAVLSLQGSCHLKLELQSAHEAVTALGTLHCPEDGKAQ